MMPIFSPAPLLNIANERFREGQWEAALNMYSLWESFHAAGIDKVPSPHLKSLKICQTFPEWAEAAGYRIDISDDFPRPSRPGCYEALPPTWRQEVRRVQERYDEGLPLVEAEGSSVFACKVGSATIQSYPISRTDDIFIQRCHLLPQLHSDPTQGAANRFHPFVDLETFTASCNFEGLEELQFDEDCLFVGGNANIYHFLYDLIGKVFSLQYFDIPDNLKYLFVNLSDWQKDVLDYLGFGLDRIIDVRVKPGNGVLMNFDRAYFIKGAPTQEVHTYLNSTLRTRLPDAHGEHHRNIYLSRDGSLDQSRIANEAELRDYLADRGYELVIPEQLSVAQKLEIIGHAETIVCAPLSGQANNVFASEAAQFVNLMPWAACPHAELPAWASVWIRHGLPLMDRSRYVFSELGGSPADTGIDDPRFYDIGRLGCVLDEVESR